MGHGQNGGRREIAPRLVEVEQSSLSGGARSPVLGLGDWPAKGMEPAMRCATLICAQVISPATKQLQNITWMSLLGLSVSNGSAAF